MKPTRREFIKLSGVGGLALASGVVRAAAASPSSDQLPHILKSAQAVHRQKFNMCGFAAPKIDQVRIGIIGLGNRGLQAVKRLQLVEGVKLVGLCDVRAERIDLAQAALVGTSHHPMPYTGKPDAWKSLCARDDVDLIYICTPWYLHAPMAVFAMESGKHAATEIPAGLTVEECWQLVETSERTRRHCRMLENTCYDFFELLTLSLTRAGFFGDIIHGEGAYIHDIAHSHMFTKDYYSEMWRLKQNVRNGNLYPTHGLGPLCQLMDINRGDQLDYLVSTSSADFQFGAMVNDLASKDPFYRPFAGKSYRGNMNTSVIRTKKGRTIMLQHDVTSPRPYSRIHLVSGTRAVAQKFPLPARVAIGEEWLTEPEFKALEDKYTPDIVRKMGDIAKEVGGHGGMDMLMDWRIIDCLRNGLPLDHDVYDAAAWSVIAPLTEWSVANRSNSIDVPDFTGGSWRQNAPVTMSMAGAGTTRILSERIGANKV